MTHCEASRLMSCLQPGIYCGLVVTAALIATPPVQAEDGWPFVRGPAFNGHATDAESITPWPDHGPPVLWSRKLGQGYSAFVARNNRVYTQAQNMTGQYVYCLKADTGETIWEYRYDWPYESAGVYPGPRSTPTLSHSRVYFTSPDGLLACLDQENGQLKWSVDLLNTYGIEGCDFGYACSPTVIDNLVILPVGGKDAGVVAFDAESGREQWRSTSEPASYTPTLPITLNGQSLVVCYMQNAVLILNRRTGQLLHKMNLSQGYDEHSAWPVYREPLLWLSGPFRAGSYAIDLTNLTADNSDLPVVWRSKILSNDVCSSVLAGDQIYGFDIFDVQSKTHRPSRGIFRCIDFQTGNERWSVGTGRPRRRGSEDDFRSDIGQSGIIVADGKLVILNELGELILLDRNPESCTELARCTILGGELTWTPPCLYQGRLYARNQTAAICVYIGSDDSLKAMSDRRVGDLPQRQYYNLAETILAVEPEYAFDIPHNRWLLQWFLAGVAVLLVGKTVVALLQSSPTLPEQRAFAEFTLTFLLAAAGTTVLGRLTSKFMFTWPLCLYAALEYVAHSADRKPTDRSSVWLYLRRRRPLFVLLLVSMAYFLICRRLSLVFEWAFLIGYVGALPFVWLTSRVRCLTPHRLFFRLVTSVLGFACFYGAAVLFLKSRY